MFTDGTSIKEIKARLSANLCELTRIQEQLEKTQQILEEWIAIEKARLTSQVDIDVTIPKSSIRQPKATNPSPSKGLIKATSYFDESE